LRDEYRIREVTKVTADSLGELADRMEIDREGFLATVAAYNKAVADDVPFNPNALDGKAAVGVEPRKSNWANRIEEPPFQAFNVTCGITFTYGGLSVTAEAEVLDLDGKPIAGLFACGEIVGGLFYGNYPSGSGLTAGSVLGRHAGAGAAKTAGATQSAGAAQAGA
jgi:tricarballylate dehydrogenase